MSGEFGTGKTIFVLAIVVGCFAVLWPKVFYPMLTASVAKPAAVSGAKQGSSHWKHNNNKEFLAKLCYILEEHQVLSPQSQTDETIQGLSRWASEADCFQSVNVTCGVTLTESILEGFQSSLPGNNLTECMTGVYGLSSQVVAAAAPPIIRHKHYSSQGVDGVGTPRPERPSHLHPDMMHPALREKGRALPQRTIDKQARPGPMPGVRPPMGGGAGHIASPQQPKGSGSMSVIMPLYTVGIIIFFLYTIMKVLFKKGPEDDEKAPKLKDFHLDPEYRKYVFAEEYLDSGEPAGQPRDSHRRPDQREATRRRPQQDLPEPKIAGKQDCEKKDEQMDQLRRRLEDTEKAMERLMSQMGSVSDKLTAAKITEVLSQAQSQAKLLKKSAQPAMTAQVTPKASIIRPSSSEPEAAKTQSSSRSTSQRDKEKSPLENSEENKQCNITSSEDMHKDSVLLSQNVDVQPTAAPSSSSPSSMPAQKVSFRLPDSYVETPPCVSDLEDQSSDATETGADVSELRSFAEESEENRVVSSEDGIKRELPEIVEENIPEFTMPKYNEVPELKMSTFLDIPEVTMPKFDVLQQKLEIGSDYVPLATIPSEQFRVPEVSMPKLDDMTPEIFMPKVVDITTEVCMQKLVNMTPEVCMHKLDNIIPEAYLPKLDHITPELCKPKLDDIIPEVCMPKLDDEAQEVCMPKQSVIISDACMPILDGMPPKVCKSKLDDKNQDVSMLKVYITPEVYMPKVGDIIPEVCIPKVSGTIQEVCMPKIDDTIPEVFIQKNSDTIPEVCIGKVADRIPEARIPNFDDTIPEVSMPQVADIFPEVCTPKVADTIPEACIPNVDDTITVICMSKVSDTIPEVCIPKVDDTISEVCKPKIDATISEVCIPKVSDTTAEMPKQNDVSQKNPDIVSIEIDNFSEVFISKENHDAVNIPDIKKNTTGVQTTQGTAEDITKRDNELHHIQNHSKPICDSLQGAYLKDKHTESNVENYAQVTSNVLQESHDKTENNREHTLFKEQSYATQTACSQLEGNEIVFSKPSNDKENILNGINFNAKNELVGDEYHSTGKLIICQEINQPKQTYIQLKLEKTDDNESTISADIQSDEDVSESTDTDQIAVGTQTSLAFDPPRMLRKKAAEMSTQTEDDRALSVLGLKTSWCKDEGGNKSKEIDKLTKIKDITLDVLLPSETQALVSQSQMESYLEKDFEIDVSECGATPCVITSQISLNIIGLEQNENNPNGKSAFALQSGTPKESISYAKNYSSKIASTNEDLKNTPEIISLSGAISKKTSTTRLPTGTMSVLPTGTMSVLPTSTMSALPTGTMSVFRHEDIINPSNTTKESDVCLCMDNLANRDVNLLNYSSADSKENIIKKNDATNTDLNNDTVDERPKSPVPPSVSDFYSETFPSTSHNGSYNLTYGGQQNFPITPESLMDCPKWINNATKKFDFDFDEFSELPEEYQSFNSAYNIEDPLFTYDSSDLDTSFGCPMPSADENLPPNYFTCSVSYTPSSSVPQTPEQETEIIFSADPQLTALPDAVVEDDATLMLPPSTHPSTPTVERLFFTSPHLNEASTVSSKGSSPDMEDYEVVQKGTDGETVEQVSQQSPAQTTATPVQLSATQVENSATQEAPTTDKLQTSEEIQSDTEEQVTTEPRSPEGEDVVQYENVASNRQATSAQHETDNVTVTQTPSEARQDPDTRSSDQLEEENIDGSCEVEEADH